MENDAEWRGEVVEFYSRYAAPVAALLVREISGLSLTALAARMKREVSALSRAARVLADKMRTDMTIASEIQSLMKNFR